MPNTAAMPDLPTARPDGARARRAADAIRRMSLLAGALLLLTAPPAAAGETAKAPVIAVVGGLAPGDLLNLRATASPYGTVLARLPVGAGLENFGCAEFKGYEWCKVTTLDAPKVSGWTPSRYLLMAGPAPAGGDVSGAPAAGWGGVAAEAPTPPQNLAARLGETGAPEGLAPADKATAEKLKSAMIAAYGPAYPHRIGPAPGAEAITTPDDETSYGPVEADEEQETGAGVPVPTPRPEQGGQAIASLAPREASPPGGAEAPQHIPCAGVFGQPMRECGVEVARPGPGDADVTVSLPGGGTRVIRFRDGRPEGSDAPGAFRYTREGSLNMIRIGAAERFEILDAVALGK